MGDKAEEPKSTADAEKAEAEKSSIGASQAILGSTVRNRSTSAFSMQSVITQDIPVGDWESMQPPEVTNDAVTGRMIWSSQIDFLMTCISMSVGFGNIYRFPFIAFENGGGAFLIPYMIIMFVVGRPAYFFELLLGQFSSLGCTDVWQMAPIFRGLGYTMALASAFTVTFYCYIMAIVILYAIYSFWNPLPWVGCRQKELMLDGKVRTDVYCEERLLNTSAHFFLPLPTHMTDGAFCAGDVDCKEYEHHTYIDVKGGNGTDAEMFFRFHVMKAYIEIDNGIGPPDLWLSLCLLSAWGIIFSLVVKGTTGSGKISWFTALFPYVIFITLFGVSVSLDNAVDGVLYFFTPKWEKLLNVGVWFQAVQQCFFSLGMGFGAIIDFGSFNDFRHKLNRDVWIVGGMDAFTSILAGATIFAILGNLANGGDISNAVTSGPSIAFVSYPSVMKDYGPYPLPQIFSFLFFFMLLTLGIGAATAMTTTTVNTLSQLFPKIPRIVVTTSVCVACFSVGLIYTTPGGTFMVLLMDTFASSLILYVVVVGEVIAVAWVYGLRNFSNDIEFMFQHKLNWYWKVCWGFVIPAGLLCVLVYNFITFQTPSVGSSPLPPHAVAAGAILAASILSVIPGFAVSVIVTRKTRSWYKKFKASVYPSRKWGPKDPEIRAAWLEYKAGLPYRYHPWRLFTLTFWKKNCARLCQRRSGKSASPDVRTDSQAKKENPGEGGDVEAEKEPSKPEGSQPEKAEAGKEAQLIQMQSDNKA